MVWTAIVYKEDRQATSKTWSFVCVSPGLPQNGNSCSAQIRSYIIIYGSGMMIYFPYIIIKDLGTV